MPTAATCSVRLSRRPGTHTPCHPVVTVGVARGHECVSSARTGSHVDQGSQWDDRMSDYCPGPCQVILPQVDVHDRECRRRAIRGSGAFAGRVRPRAPAAGSLAVPHPRPPGHATGAATHPGHGMGRSSRSTGSRWVASSLSLSRGGSDTMTPWLGRYSSMGRRSGPGGPALQVALVKAPWQSIRGRYPTPAAAASPSMRTVRYDDVFSRPAQLDSTAWEVGRRKRPRAEFRRRQPGTTGGSGGPSGGPGRKRDCPG